MFSLLTDGKVFVMLGRDNQATRRLFESRTEVWRQVGLGGEIEPEATRRSRKRARVVAVVLAVLIVATLVAFNNRRELFPGLGTPVRIATVAILVVLGWALARSLASGLAAPLYRRLEPGVAGTVGSTGWTSFVAPAEPKKAASPKAKIPPSDATIQ
jgi:hypothetical protein